MVSEILGPISNAHVVHADRSKYGAMDEKCIQLAELAATAVDFPKTGKIVTMPPFLRPQEYPDFMGKEDDISYKSEKNPWKALSVNSTVYPCKIFGRL